MQPPRPARDTAVDGALSGRSIQSGRTYPADLRTNATMAAARSGEQRDGQRVRDLNGDVVLQSEDVVEGSVEAVRPDLRFVGGIDQLGRDPDLLALPSHAALDDVADAELSCDLTHGRTGSLETHRRGPRDDT